MREVRVESDALEAVLLPDVGARLHRLRAFGVDLLRTPPDPATHGADPFFWGGYVLAPWGNRLDAGRQAVAGQTVNLAPNFDDGSAIHGQVYARSWEVVGDGRLRVAGGGDGWPWPYDVTLDVTAVDRTLTLDLELRNLADTPMPAGLGLHPWFKQPVLVSVRAGSVFRSNTEPGPEPEPVAGALDLRPLGAMADDLDATWADLADPPVELAWPEDGITARLEFDAPARYVTAASPSGLGAIAVEPQTHVPQGLRRLRDGLSGGLTMLSPSETLRLAVRMTVWRADSADSPGSSSVGWSSAAMDALVDLEDKEAVRRTTSR